MDNGITRRDVLQLSDLMVSPPEGNHMITPLRNSLTRICPLPTPATHIVPAWLRAIPKSAFQSLRIVLAAFDLPKSDFSPTYLKPVLSQDKMVQNELQGFAMMAGTPAKAVTLLSDIGLFLVPIDSNKASGITALWSDRTLSLLKQGHPQGKLITPETALTGLSVPLHAGAERYYREKELMLKGVRSP
jgi:TRAP-type uncharacterized transport system substrate-binding protein